MNEPAEVIHTVGSSHDIIMFGGKWVVEGARERGEEGEITS